MSFAAAILSHTPVYVWALFAFIAWQGITALRPRTVPLWRMMLVPALFILAGVLPLAWRAGGPGLLGAWTAGMVLFLPLGYRTGPLLLTADPAAGTVTRAGSPGPLVRNVLVFVVQYGLAVAAVLHTDDRTALLLAARAVSGATAGYFLGWVASAWRQYKAARATTPAA